MEKVIIFSFTVLATAFAEPHLHHPYEEAIVLPSQDVAAPYPYHSQSVGLKFYGEEPGLVAATADVAASKLSLIFRLMPTVVPAVIAFVKSGIFPVAKAIVVSVLTKLPMLLISAMVAIGICKLTPLCTKLSHFTDIEEVVSLATPERITRAAEFVEKAVQKFSALQDSDGNVKL